MPVLFIFIFIAFSLLYIIVESSRKKEISFQNESMSKLPRWLMMVFKGLPAATAAVFVLTTNNNSLVIHLGLLLALVFCLAGDVGMEIGLIAGMLLFAVAQVLFITTYTVQALVMEPAFESLVITGTVAISVLIYIFLFLKYLMTPGKEKNLGKLKIPVFIYSSLLGLHFCAAVFLWSSVAMNPWGLVVVLGGLLFLISDSIIAVREFHHEISLSTIKVMGTYYLCLLFISLTVLVY